jgi:peptidyl-tRNA hydrolase
MEDVPALAVTAEDEKIVLYVVMRQRLKLVGGKIGAQVGHAVMFIVEEAAREHQPTPDELRLRRMRVPLTEDESKALEALEQADDRRRARQLLYQEWRAGEYGKIVLAASDEEFHLVKMRYGTSFLVIDNGHTQVEPNTETCVGIWPMRKKDRCDLLLRLKPLR